MEDILHDFNLRSTNTKLPKELLKPNGDWAIVHALFIGGHKQEAVASNYSLSLSLSIYIYMYIYVLSLSVYIYIYVYVRIYFSMSLSYMPPQQHR